MSITSLIWQTFVQSLQHGHLRRDGVALDVLRADEPLVVVELRGSSDARRLSRRHQDGAPRRAVHLPEVGHPPGELALAADADGVAERVPEVLRHEAVDDGVDAAVEVGHQPERLSDGLEVALVQVRQHVEGDEEVVHHDGTPAQREEDHHRYQHLDHLQK